MTVFFDTNVLIAAYATHGACNELLVLKAIEGIPFYCLLISGSLNR